MIWSRKVLAMIDAALRSDRMIGMIQPDFTLADDGEGDEDTPAAIQRRMACTVP